MKRNGMTYHRSRKGIEPLVAAILLIAISIIVALAIYTWLSGYVQSTMSKAEGYVMYEAITIDAVNYSSTLNTVSMYVRNIGSVPVNISAAYVLDESGSIVCSNTKLTVKLEPNEVQKINVSCSSSLASGTYLARVVTATGVKAETWFTVR